MDLDLAGNTALVTASSSGLGKAAAIALAAEGVNVVINGRDEERLKKAVADVEATATGAVLPIQGDLTNACDITNLVNTTIEEFGSLEHLVTSAGGPPSGPFLETDDDDWYLAFDLLVMSVVRLAREAAPHLCEGKGGTITAITSRTVKEAQDSLVLSNAVRMSVVGLTKTLSREFAPNVRVNTVLPGTHETSRMQDLIRQAVDRGEFKSYEDALKVRGENVPIGRIGDPMELGNTVAFLCSPAAGYINGEAIVIDGGSGRSTL